MRTGRLGSTLKHWAIGGKGREDPEFKTPKRGPYPSLSLKFCLRASFPALIPSMFRSID